MRLALDPGKTTGVGWRTPEGDLHGIEWPGDLVVVILDGFHSTKGIDELVVERFRSRPGPAVNLSAPIVIGRILAWAEEHQVPVILQDPSWPKRKVHNDVLRELGGWIRGQEHARDALRHLIYWEGKQDEVVIPKMPKK